MHPLRGCRRPGGGLMSPPDHPAQTRPSSMVHRLTESCLPCLHHHLVSARSINTTTLGTTLEQCRGRLSAINAASSRPMINGDRSERQTTTCERIQPRTAQPGSWAADAVRPCTPERGAPLVARKMKQAGAILRARSPSARTPGRQLHLRHIARRSATCQA